MQCQRGMYFSFNFVWYSILGVWLDEQNLLSLLKVICWWSLKSYSYISKVNPVNMYIFIGTFAVCHEGCWMYFDLLLSLRPYLWPTQYLPVKYKWYLFCVTTCSFAHLPFSVWPLTLEKSDYKSHLPPSYALCFL